MKRGYSLSYFLFTISILSLPKTLFSQNVGIGTTTPTRARLEVYGAAGSTNAIFGGESTGISVQRNWPGIGFNEYHGSDSRYMANGFAAVEYLDPVSGFLIFDMFPNGSKDAIIPSYQRGLVISVNGNVGVRTNPGSAALNTVKAGNASGSAVFGGTLYNSHFDYGATEDTYIRGGKSSSKVFLNDIGGNVLMGNGNTHVSINNGIPTYTLEIREVNETGLRLVQSSTNSNYWEMRVGLNAFTIPNPGSDLNMIYTGQYKCFFEMSDGHLFTYSDRRLKTNIRDMPSILEKFMKLEPVEYNMKYINTKHNKTMGFIAQDVQQLFPQLVAVTANSRQGYPGIDRLYGLNYNGFRMLTIKALQEQQEKIKKMQQQNEELEKRIAAAEVLLRADKH
jgi:Chaperone of endosialidase